MEREINMAQPVDYKSTVVDNSHQAMAMPRKEEVQEVSTMAFYSRSFDVERRDSVEQLGYLQEKIAELYNTLTPIFGEAILAEMERANGIYTKEQSAPIDMANYPIPSPIFNIMAEQIIAGRRNRDKVGLLLTHVEYLIKTTRHHI